MGIYIYKRACIAACGGDKNAGMVLWVLAY